MKIFFRKIFVFALIIAICDFAVGLVGDWLVEHAKGGDTLRKTYIANKTNEDILVFGSSRARHHYDPDILEDSLGLSVYNCGFSGNGIICEYGFYRMISERYNPSVIIYDVESHFDLLIGDNHKYLGVIRPFYNQSGVGEIFADVDKTEKFKMVSRMYKYNSALIQLLIDNIHPLHGNTKGYNPLDRNLRENTKPLSEPETYNYDSLKIKYLEKLINDCKGKTKLVFAISPYYSKTSSRVMEPLVELCKKYDVPLIDNYTNDSFNQVRDYFADSDHLNRTGATEYSKYVASILKHCLND